MLSSLISSQLPPQLSQSELPLLTSSLNRTPSQSSCFPKQQQDSFEQQKQPSLVLLQAPLPLVTSQKSSFTQPPSLLQQLDDILPLYMDTYESDAASLAQNVQSIASLLEQPELSTPETALSIQQRLQVLVFQNPVEAVAASLKPLLTQDHSEEPMISNFFINEDFPSLIQLQPILASMADESHQQNNDSDEISLEINSSSDSNSDTALLENLKSCKVHMGNHNPANLKDLLLNIFNEFRGRFPNLLRPLLMFPTYLEEFFASFACVFSSLSCSPWQEQSLYALGMLTASSYENQYVFSLFADLYEAYDSSFLEFGYDALDAKTKKAWDLILFLRENSPIKIVADVALMKDLYASLLQSWSHADLTFAIIAISFAQQLVMLVQGLGITNEAFTTQAFTAPTNMMTSLNRMCSQNITLNRNSSSNTSSTFSGNSSNQSSKKPSEDSQTGNQQNSRMQVEKLTKEVVDLLQNHSILLLEAAKSTNSTTEFDELTDMVNVNEEDNKVDDESGYHEFDASQFDKLLESTDDLNVTTSPRGGNVYSNSNINAISASNNKNFKKYTGPVESSRFIFKRRSQRKCLWKNQYTWKEHVFAFLSQRYPALEKLLSKKMNIVQDMTLRSFGTTVEIDTQVFRTAVWKYCELSMGYVDPSYDYAAHVDTLLKKPLRTFLNKLIFKPKEVRLADLNDLPYLFETQDLVHLVILAAEAKFYTQITLLFHSLQQSTK